jgi:hypothetical protein
MSLLMDDGDRVLFAQLTDAYWLDDTSTDCRECRFLAGRQEDAAPVGAGHVVDLPGWLRLVMLLIALITVTAAAVATARA